MQVWTAYLAIELLLAVVASAELLTDAVSNSSAAAASDRLLLAPLASAGSEGLHSTLSSSNSLVGLVRGNSTHGSNTPRVSSVSTLFTMNNRATTSSSPRGSMASLQSLGAAAAGGAAAAASTTAEDAAGPGGNAASQGGAGVSPTPITRSARTQSVALSAPVVAAQHPGVAPLSAATVSTLVDVLWRPVLAGLSCSLAHCRSRSSHESLMLVLLRGFQSYIFSAGALGEVPARDDFLKVCSFHIAQLALFDLFSTGCWGGSACKVDAFCLGPTRKSLGTAHFAAEYTTSCLPAAPRSMFGGIPAASHTM